MEYVLFVCLANSIRSQMAQAIFNDRKRFYPAVDRKYEAISAGIYDPPGIRIGSAAAQALKEIGIDVRDSSVYHPKTATREMVEGAARVISLEDSVHDLFGYELRENWGIKDTFGQDVGITRKRRDEIAVKVSGLVEELFQKETR